MEQVAREQHPAGRRADRLADIERGSVQRHRRGAERRGGTNQPYLLHGIGRGKAKPPDRTRGRHQREVAGAKRPDTGPGNFALMAAAVAVWGLGFASTNSMQQVRLVGAVPALCTASVSLDTSALYICQAIGSGPRGTLFPPALLFCAGYFSRALLSPPVFF